MATKCHECMGAHHGANFRIAQAGSHEAFVLSLLVLQHDCGMQRSVSVGPVQATEGGRLTFLHREVKASGVVLFGMSHQLSHLRIDGPQLSLVSQDAGRRRNEIFLSGGRGGEGVHHQGMRTLRLVYGHTAGKRVRFCKKLLLLTSVLRPQTPWDSGETAMVHGLALQEKRKRSLLTVGKAVTLTV